MRSQLGTHVGAPDKSALPPPVCLWWGVCGASGVRGTGVCQHHLRVQRARVAARLHTILDTMTIDASALGKSNLLPGKRRHLKARWWAEAAVETRDI